MSMIRLTPYFAVHVNKLNYIKLNSNSSYPHADVWLGSNDNPDDECSDTIYFKTEKEAKVWYERVLGQISVDSN